MFWKRKKIPIDVGRTPEAAHYLADTLEYLMSLPLATKEDVQHWYSESDQVQITLQEKFPQFRFYHEVWHFIADADIRARDSGYLDYQHQLMLEYITMLRENRTAFIQ